MLEWAARVILEVAEQLAVEQSLLLEQPLLLHWLRHLHLASRGVWALQLEPALRYELESQVLPLWNPGPLARSGA